MMIKDMKTKIKMNNTNQEINNSMINIIQKLNWNKHKSHCLPIGINKLNKLLDRNMMRNMLIIHKMNGVN